MNFTLIVTIGPSLLANKKALLEIDNFGPCIYRLNGAHLIPSEVKPFVSNIKSVLPNAAIMVDLPGNKIRTSGLTNPIILQKEWEGSAA